MSLLLSCSTVIFLANRAAAFIAFQPNCTTPPEHVDFVSSPQVRATMGIVWSCFSVLLLCTWNIQHLSVPIHVEPKKDSCTPRESKNPSWIRALGEEARFLLANLMACFLAAKLKWMGLSLIAPEYLFGKALTECLAAHDSRRQFRHEAWTTTHGYFSNMRGFVLRFDVAAVPTSLEPTKPEKVGRSLHKMRPEGDPPYYEQDVERAQAIELEQCRKICGDPCRNRLDAADIKKTGFPSDPRPNSQAASTKQADPREHQEIDVEAEKQSKATMTENMEDSRTLRDLGSHRSEDFPADTTTHTLVNGQKPPREGTGNEMVQVGETRPWTSTQCGERPGLGPHKTWKGTWALSSIQLLYAYQNGIIPNLPNVTLEELKDRSKGDAFVKGFAVIQITWLVVQIIARVFQDLAITLLEITVVAFAACAIIIYILLWHKPKDVQVPTYIDATETLTREQIIGLAARSPVATLMVQEFWLHGVAVRVMADNIFPWTPGIALRMRWMKEPVFLNPIFVGITFGGVLFGAIHFAAWNFESPTPVERLLWRISCTVLVVFPLLGVLIYCTIQHAAKITGHTNTRANRLSKAFDYVFGLMYLLARLFLLAEVFRSLAYLPPSAYQDVEWPSAIPHIG